MTDPNIRSQPWESCPVATRHCMDNECRETCVLDGPYPGSAVENSCTSIDCGGKESAHSSDCAYMNDTFGEPNQRPCTGSITGKCQLRCADECEVPYMGARHNAEIKDDVTYPVGSSAALDVGYSSNEQKEWKIEGHLTAYFHNEKILRGMFSWEKAITSNTGLTKRQMSILRHPQSHAADPLVTISLIQRGLIDVQKRWKLFGENVVILTRAGRKAQKNLPPACYRSEPSPQAQSENDCFSCRHRVACMSFDMMEPA